MAGHFSGQVSSSAVMAVARTSTSNSPGPGSGTGTISQVRLDGSALAASMARMRTGSVTACLRFCAGTPARVGSGAAGCPAGSAKDPFGWVHVVIPAPGQVYGALGSGVDGLDDLAVVVEILNGPSDLDVHHAGLVADRPPSVDGTGRLVHVAARSDQLAAAEDLTGTADIEGMHLAGMAMER